MANVLVLVTTLASIRGLYAREFLEGEVVELDDDDLVGVGIRDGWLALAAEGDGEPAPAPSTVSRYTVLRHEDLPPHTDWGAPPEDGDVIELSDEVAGPLVEAGVIAAVEDTHKLPQQAAPLEGGTRGGAGDAGDTPGDAAPVKSPGKKKTAKAVATQGGSADAVA